MPLLN